MPVLTKPELALPEPPPAPVTTPPAATTGSLVGAVDNVGATRVYGWAWNPARPEERVAIELRLAGSMVLRVIADQLRADLPGSGIGDGYHAFDLPLDAECVAHRAELAIVACGANGTEAALPFRIRRNPATEQEQTRRAIASLTEGQQILGKRLQLMQAERGQSAETQRLAGRVLEAEIRLEARLATIETWLLRVDERLAALPVPAVAASRSRRVDPWQVVLMAVLAAVAGGAGVAVAIGPQRVLAMLGAT